MSLWKLVLQKAIQQTLLYLPPEDPVARAQMHWNKFSQREREKYPFLKTRFIHHCDAHFGSQHDIKLW